VVHPASRNPCGSDPSNPIPQTLGSSLQLGCHEPDHQPIRRPITELRILTHVGRTSGWSTGRLNVFRGRNSESVKNVVAAGACQIVTRGVRYQLSAPTIVHDPTRQRFPFPVRVILGLIGANDFHAAFDFSHTGHGVLAKIGSGLTDAGLREAYVWSVSRLAVVEGVSTSCIGAGAPSNSCSRLIWAPSSWDWCSERRRRSLIDANNSPSASLDRRIIETRTSG
jgi:hypothetical protein